MTTRDEPEASYAPLDPDDGWIRCSFEAIPVPVDMRLAENSGRYRVVAIRIEDDSGINASTLRAVPLGAVETHFNTQAAHLVDAIKAVSGMRPSEALRAERQKAARTSARRLKIPKVQPFGEVFYGTVADIYRDCVAAGLPPGPTLAEAKGVPLTQAHGWIRTARNRGLLRPGQRGKTGG